MLADANCHKSICHSLTVTGARPVYLTPTRNGYGMIGLVPAEAVLAGGDPGVDQEQSFFREGGVAGADRMRR